MKFNVKYVLSPVFITALIVLLCNDFWFKAAFSNTITGKLSDFSGVLVLGLLFNFFSEKNRKLNVLFVIVLFTFWKSPLSEGLIFAWNHLVFYPIDRVVDYWDLLAFTVLPVVSHYKFKEVERSGTLVFATITIILTFFTLCSTSRTDHIDAYGYGPIQHQWTNIYEATSKLSEEEFIEAVKRQQHFDIMKKDSVEIDHDRYERYTLSKTLENINYGEIHSCQFVIHQKNDEKIIIQLLSLKLYNDVDFKEFSKAKALKELYQITKVKRVERLVGKMK